MLCSRKRGSLSEFGAAANILLAFPTLLCIQKNKSVIDTIRRTTWKIAHERLPAPSYPCVLSPTRRARCFDSEPNVSCPPSRMHVSMLYGGLCVSVCLLSHLFVFGGCGEIKCTAVAFRYLTLPVDCPV